jgi:hypothetical protein
MAVTVSKAVVIGANVARMFWWTIPALRDSRSTPSPPVAAVDWILHNVPRTAKIYVHGSMGPWTSYYLRDYHTTFIEGPEDLPMEPVRKTEWYLTEGSSGIGGAQNFVRDRGRLFDIARRRYFEVSVAPASSLWRFVSGWYGEEVVGFSAWRWMSGHSQTLLPPVAGTARLSLGFDLPSELVPRRPVVEIRVNGNVIDRLVCTTPSVAKSWVVPARSDAWNTLEIVLDKVINPQKEGISPDARDLGLNLTSYSWVPAGAS